MITAITNLVVLFSGIPTFTHQQVNYNEFLDVHQFALNFIVAIACIYALCSCGIRFLPLIRLVAGCCLVVANLAYPIFIFIKISRHDVGYGGGCNGYDSGTRTGSQWGVDRNSGPNASKTRCYMQYMIGTLSVLIAFLVATEVGLSWRMSQDQEYLDQVQKEREETELKELQRRQRAMLVHHYQPDLTLEHDDTTNNPRITPRGSTEGDVLPVYQQRETAVGLGRLVDMGHIVDGEAEEVCPFPYREQEDEEEGGGEDRDAGYMDPSPFSAGDIEAQAGRPMPPSTEERNEGGRGVGSGTMTVSNESEAENQTLLALSLRIIRTLLLLLASANLCALFAGLQILPPYENTPFPVDFQETSHLALNGFLFLAVVYSFLGRAEWSGTTRLTTGIVLATWSLALNINEIKNIQYKGGCSNGIAYNYDDIPGGTGGDRDFASSFSVRTRCQIQMVISGMGITWAVLLVAELFMTNTHRKRIMVKFGLDRPTELEVMPRVVHVYQPDLSLEAGVNTPQATSTATTAAEPESLPAYEPRSTGPRVHIIDMTRTARGPPVPPATATTATGTVSPGATGAEAAAGTPLPPPPSYQAPHF
ncbi:hypothetical protein BGZ96_005710 [Linnemannia gamsii]|uniref:MARVEL domain-containing protein n=1 Tax=Linnemannia gamsii TaxID=64522 RepID=A0ABQ7K522_9FUNG|nr:hypothetical protein BGZ96_005710 [Linnemannia gamsii]